MTICSFSVVRPVATIVLMLILIVFGLIGLRNMPVREYPDIDVPTISISTEYDGASASVVETKITEIIEDCMKAHKNIENPTLEQILETEAATYERINSRR